MEAGLSTVQYALMALLCLFLMFMEFNSARSIEEEIKLYKYLLLNIQSII